jgi:hypothetical protein
MPKARQCTHVVTTELEDGQNLEDYVGKQS